MSNYTVNEIFFLLFALSDFSKLLIFFFSKTFFPLSPPVPRCFKYAVAYFKNMFHWLYHGH